MPNDPVGDVYAKTEQRNALVREVVRRLRAATGVENAAMSSVVPLQGPVVPNGFRLEGAAQDADAPRAVRVSVTPEFFQTIGTPLIRGRMFEETDIPTSPRVALVDEAAARRFWGDRDPIGRRIRFSRGVPGTDPNADPWMTVVGLVGNIKLSSLDEKDVPHVYNSMYQISDRNYGVLVRATGDQAALARTVQHEIQSVDPNLPVSPMTEISEMMSAGVGDRRFAAWLLAGFALVALLLTSVGVYGVASYAIVRREKEIGIRSALGASRGQLVSMVLREGMIPVLAGLVVGGIAAALSSRLLAALLFNVHAGDAAVMACAGVVLVAIGILSNYLPARRAGRIDPIIALRSE